ncbi:DUF2306 domain-containing protein [Dactylosporangium siamense]|uniref:DUF2306 domain-containing protein n=1 Tax=Dactylosporangium siamense TaxID=685454 RepID=A0A919U9R4_9ACTN|nr:DUF2306 domain-containing protein [Dactylosporangium siamense]GIG47187.1 hypothetical protein Dsi01nite_052280 [Dactylosporangium siamense]
MTQHAQITRVAGRRPGVDAEPAPPTNHDRRPRVRPGVVLVALFVAAFLIDTLPPYLGLDPAKSRIVLRPDFAGHYTLLILHIAAGTIALSTLCLQLWPWLRRTHPKVHRTVGRIYVFGGALPSALLALAIMPLTHGWSANMGITFHAVLWFAVTAIGFWHAKHHRYALHRRFMLYSVALALGILWGRATVNLYLLLPVKFDVGYVFEMARWGGWFINLLVVQWWLERTDKRNGVQHTLPAEDQDAIDERAVPVGDR